MNLRTRAVATTVLLWSAFDACATERAVESPFTVEYYYKIKWGHYEEWLELYKRNHWPIMQAEMKDGDILHISVDQPQNSSPEPYRWDARVTITFKNILIPHGLTDRSLKRAALIARLYPNRELYDREERRRTELLDGFWEVELDPVATGDWLTNDRQGSH